MGHYGIGALTSVTILAELGDASTGSSSSRAVVRYAGLDITVHSIRPASRTRTTLPPRTTSTALGAVRSSAMRPGGASSIPDDAYYLESCCSDSA